MNKKIPDDKDRLVWNSFIKHIQKIPKLNDKQFYVPHTTAVVRDKIHLIRRREYYEELNTSFNTVGSLSSVRKNLKVGKVVIEGRIDLHGLFVENAQEKLKYFLVNAQLQRKRWVLVITGKGNPENDKTLKRLVPTWLDHLPYVAGYAVAKPVDGGGGALYVRIKKLRP